MLLGVVVSGMPLAVAAAVLGSAVAHAAWNAIAKAIPERLAASLLIGVGYLVFGGLWCLVAPLPAAASWPYLATSVIVQTGYLLLLTAAYAHGEFRQIYPLSRGTAPVIVTIVSVAALGEHLGGWQFTGVALIVAALAVLVTAGHSGTSGYLLAVATGVVIGCYSLVDGVGVRHSGTTAGYAAWLMMLQGPLLIGVCLMLAGPRRMLGWLRAGVPRTVPLGLAGGLLSVISYAIVLWAQSRAGLSLVSALRETSVLLAGLIGALVFGERLSTRQMLSAAVVVCGIVAIQLG